MANEWTTEYPTKPGYYWIRNYMIACDPQCRREHVAETDSDVVRIDSDLECFWPGNEVGRRKADIISAEWCGPIQPPTEPQQPKAANLTELFHNSLTNRGKQVLANQAVDDLERQEGEGK